VIRTVKVKLDVPDERCDDLHQTKEQFLHCANTTAEWVWRYPIVLGASGCVTKSRFGCSLRVVCSLSILVFTS
jgi:hypothetical protein